MRDLGDRRRQAELDAQAQVLEKSGMTAERFGRARERLERNRPRITAIMTRLGVKA